MVTKRQKIAAIAVIAIVIIAGIAFVLLTQPPEQTMAERMVLTANDLGLDWTGGRLPSGAYPNLQGETSRAFWEFEGPESATMLLYSNIFVFNSTAQCISAYLNEITSFRQNTTSSITNNMLGDGGMSITTYYDGAVTQYGLIFHRENVLCMMFTEFSPPAPKPWEQGSLTYFAMLQLEKIDSILPS